MGWCKQTWMRVQCRREAVGAILGVLGAVREHLMLLGPIILENKEYTEFTQFLRRLAEANPNHCDTQHLHSEADREFTGNRQISN